MKILVIFPHPDDATLNCGGSMARWVAEGHHITAAEAFITQTCAPGHFENLPRLTAQMLNAPAEPPVVI